MNILKARPWVARLCCKNPEDLGDGWAVCWGFAAARLHQGLDVQRALFWNPAQCSTLSKELKRAVTISFTRLEASC